MPLRVSEAMSVTYAAKRKLYGSGTTSLTISNEEMEDIIEVVKSFEESAVITEGIRITIKNEAKEQKGGFLTLTLGTLVASL